MAKKATTEEIRAALAMLHDQENEYNKQVGLMNKQMQELRRKKAKLAKQVSKNMRHRNKLIDML